MSGGWRSNRARSCARRGWPASTSRVRDARQGGELARFFEAQLKRAYTGDRGRVTMVVVTSAGVGDSVAARGLAEPVGVATAYARQLPAFRRPVGSLRCRGRRGRGRHGTCRRSPAARFQQLQGLDFGSVGRSSGPTLAGRAKTARAAAFRSPPASAPGEVSAGGETGIAEVARRLLLPGSPDHSAPGLRSGHR